ncbi:MAG: hypothetical protein Q7J29_13100 [Stagnimonas sp.]|nr:hypothetical protein [Stagnimonas sp.]
MVGRDGNWLICPLFWAGRLQSSSNSSYATNVYTSNGQINFTRDAKNNLTDFSYDGFDRLNKTLFADGSYEEYFFDANSNVTAKRNRSGQTIGFAFDALNRETARTVPATADGFARTLTTSYDLASRKWDITADGQSLRNRYDTAGRPNFVGDSLLNSLGSSGTAGNISYTYDGSSNRSGFTVFANDSTWTPSYVYDDASRLQQVHSAGTNLALYSLNPLSQRKSTTLLDGSSIAYDYFPNSDLKTLTHTWSGNSLTLGYTRNGARQITALSLSDDTFLPNPPETARTYSTNNLNQYTTVASNGQAPGSNTLSYDGNGNLTGDGVWTFKYDEEMGVNNHGEEVVAEPSTTSGLKI